MKEAFIKTGTKVEIHDSPIPKAGEHQVVIKVVVSGSNPKDWKYPDWVPDSGQINQGDDIAGTIHEVGPKVTGFHVGDRVAAFHEMLAPHGSYAEYAVAYDYTTFSIPAETSFEEAAALPLAAMTACYGLFSHKNLDLPAPWRSQQTKKTKTPLVVYGGASAVGSYVIQLAQKAGIHPIIAIAGRGQDHTLSLLDKSKGDAVVDYRKGDEAVVAGVKEALKAAGVDTISHAYDAVSSKETQTNCFGFLAENGRLTTVLPGQSQSAPKNIHVSETYVGDAHAMNDATEEDKDFAAVYFNYLARGLEQGWLKAHNPEVVPGGLSGVEGALKNLRDGKASAVKYVFRIADTPGAGSGS